MISRAFPEHIEQSSRDYLRHTTRWKDSPMKIQIPELLETPVYEVGDLWIPCGRHDTRRRHVQAEGPLRKLEARLTDRTGLVPHTQAWVDYWMARMEKLVNGEPFDEKIPFARSAISRASPTVQ
jgi:hypothetical protein